MFSTMTKDEAKRFTGTWAQPEDTKRYVLLDDTNLSASVDWRTKGFVNAVKNQGHCGSCWAFGATAVVEAAHKAATGTLLNLSEQEVVSCDTKSHGCQGGAQIYAFMYLEQHKQELTADYPYTSGTTKKTGTCEYMASKGKVMVKGYSNVQRNSVSQTKAAIDKTVVTVAIEADKSVFQQYKSGIFDSKLCGTHLDHAVALVGYGTEAGKDYYILRNSWGSVWGDQGYMKIAAVNGAGICGVQMQPQFASSD